MIRNDFVFEGVNEPSVSQPTNNMGGGPGTKPRSLGKTSMECGQNCVINSTTECAQFTTPAWDR